MDADVLDAHFEALENARTEVVNATAKLPDPLGDSASTREQVAEGLDELIAALSRYSTTWGELLTLIRDHMAAAEALPEV